MEWMWEKSVSTYVTVAHKAVCSYISQQGYVALYSQRKFTRDLPEDGTHAMKPLLSKDHGHKKDFLIIHCT